MHKKIDYKKTYFTFYKVRLKLTVVCKKIQLRHSNTGNILPEGKQKSQKAEKVQPKFYLRTGSGREGKGGIYLLVMLVERRQHLEGPGRRNSGGRQSLMSLHRSKRLLLKPPTTNNALKAYPPPLASPPSYLTSRLHVAS